MKRFLFIIMMLLIISVFAACNSQEVSPLLYKDNLSGRVISHSDDVTKLKYTIDKITLSKSYQSIDPGVEVITNGLDATILLSLGIVESSGIEIEKIEKDHSNINIYVQNENKDTNPEIVVPQALIHFDDLTPNDIETLNFNIINQNYSPIKVNIDIGEAISKIESSLKISASTFPDISIDRKNDNLFLNLNFINVVDLENKENPIINLNVLIDLTDGKIVKSSKSTVSSLIDEGNILEYVPNKYILYIKEEIIKEDINTDLWIYDIQKESKEKIYSTKNKIKSLKFNEDEDKAFLIESSLEYNELYILEIKDLKMYKANIDKEINPFIGTWKNNETIVLVDKNDTMCGVYDLNISSNNLNYITSIDKEIKEIDYLNDYFLFSVEIDNLKEIYITKNFIDNLFIDKGTNPLFVNNNTIGYLKNDPLKNKNLLWFYDIEDKSTNFHSEMDVQAFLKWKDNLGIIEKSQIGSDNPLHIYNLEKEEMKFVTSVRSDKIFLNSDKNILYINSYMNIKENKTKVISFINLKP